MDKLEKFIRENRNLFDENEPTAGHFDRFSEKFDTRLGKPDPRMDRWFLLKIAAGFLIILTVSVLLFDFAGQWVRSSAGTTATVRELPSDLQDAVNYYDETAAERLGRIQKLACCGQDSKALYSIAFGELKSLSASARELQKTLKETPDERVAAALIRNQQMKETVLNNMIRQMKNAKK